MLSCYGFSVLAGSSGKNLPLTFQKEVSLSSLLAPKAGGISGPVSVCEGDVKVYTYPFTAGYSYSWSATNGSAAPVSNTCTVTWGTAGSGTVNIIVKDAMGTVVFTQSLPVTIHAKPNPFITAGFSPTCEPPEKREDKPNVIIPPPPTPNDDTCFKACDSSIITYTAPLNPGSTYTWSASGSISISPSGNKVDVYWGAPGNGLISVTETNVWGCTNTYQKCVKIIPSPDASFTSNPAAVGGVITICKGQTITFTDQSSAGLGSPLFNWTWNFGDGSPLSTDQNPSHQFNTPGLDTVIMYVENECHCKDSFYVLVKVLPQTAPVIECVSTVCHNDTASYSSPSGCPGAQYHWTVTNGVIIGASGPDSAQITVLWGASGPGTVSLMITGCGSPCPVASTVSISIISPTTTISGSDPACIYSTTGNSYGYSIPVMAGSNYTWTISPAGAGTIVNGQGTNIIEVQWNSGPSATLSVSYYNPSLNCGGTASKVITIRPPFTITGVDKVCENNSSSYTATNAVNNAAYSWTVTNSSNVVMASGSGSNVFPVSWTFGPGLYTVTATNNSGEFCNSPQIFFVNVIAAPPMVASVSGPTPVCPGVPYTYSSAPTGPGYYLVWQAVTGTPATSYGTSTSIAWTGAGPYQLKVYQVTMTSPACSSAAFIYNVNSKINPAPVYTVSGPSPTCNNSVRNYSVTGTVAADVYTWSVAPTSAGSVTGGQGTSNVTIEWTNGTTTATITVVAKVCGVNFTSTPFSVPFVNPVPTLSNPGPICQGQTVTFTASAGGTQYDWDFGDGTTVTTASSTSPPHTYNVPGSYPVTVGVTNLSGCIGIFNAATTLIVKPNPVISISTSSPTVWCPSVTSPITLTSAITTGSGTVNWYKSPATFIGSGPTVTIPAGAGAPGTYYAEVTWNGCTGRSNLITIRIDCPVPCPIAAGSAVSYTYTQACQTINFTGSITAGGRIVGWNFDDLSTAGAVTSVSHTYAEPGYYYATIIGRFPKVGGGPGDSCDLPWSQLITINYKPNFGYNILCPLTPTSGYRVQLYDKTTVLSGAPSYGYSWTGTGGTPASSTLASPIIDYSPAGGTFNVTMSLTGAGAPCTITLPVVVPAAPNLSITTTPNPVCEGNPVAFNVTGVGAGLVKKWTWNFGELTGAASNVPTPLRSYVYSDVSASGTFANAPVTLTYLDKFGCTKTTSVYNQGVYKNLTTVSVTPPGPITMCQGSSVNLTAAASGGTSPYTYLWSTTATINPITVTQSGVYNVESKDTRGCRARSADVIVKVIPLPPAVIFGKVDYCAGEKVTLTANQGPNPPFSYQWNVDGSPSTSGADFAQILAVGTHTITVTVTDVTTGCVNTSANYIVNVHALPSVSASASPVPACAGTPTTLTAFTAALPPYYTWSNGATSNPIVVTTAAQYTVYVTDVYGCQSPKANVPVHPLPDFSNLMTGCYEFCDTGNVPLVGPYDPTYMYQWYWNGNPIPAGLGGTNRTYSVPVGQNGSYTLKITTTWGCVLTSGTVDIVFVHCPSQGCQTDFTLKSIVCVKEENGVRTYVFQLQIFNPFPNGTSYTLYSTTGTISGLSPATLNNGSNLVTGVYTDVAPYHTQFCVGGTIAFNGRICKLIERCFPVPQQCPPPQPCNTQGRWRDIQCIGRDANGYPVYSFAYDVFWTGSNGSSIVMFNTTNGSVSGLSPVTLNNGWNTITGTLTNSSGLGTFCFEAYVYDPVAQRVCFFKDCIDLPECNTQPCHAEGEWIKITCIGQNSDGYPMYSFQYNLYWGGPNGAPIASFTSPNGPITSLTPSTLNTGWNTITGVITNTSGTNPFCFEMYVQIPGTNNKCYFKDCKDLPECNLEPCHADGKWQTIVCIGTDANGYPQYYFEYNFGWGGANGSPIVSFTSPTGTISGLSLSSVNTGSNLITGVFTNTSGSTDPFCFNMVIHDVKSEKDCFWKDCIDLPECNGIDPCDADGKWINMVCIGKDANGNAQYYFEYKYGWGGANGSPIVSFTSPAGTVSGLSLSSVNNGGNLITGIFTWTDPSNPQFCFEMKVYDRDANKVCLWKDCIDVPNCPDIEPCEKQGKFLNIICIGKDENNNPQYYFDFGFDWTGPDGSPIVSFFTTNGPVSGLSINHANNGSNVISGILTNTSGTDPFCFEMKIFDPDKQVVCTIKDCVRLPDCGRTGDCGTDISFDAIKCAGFDKNGYQLYDLYMNINNPFGSSANIYFTSPEGGFSNTTPNNIPPGGSSVYTQFTDLPPAAGTQLCFTVIFVDADGNICTQDVCIDLPRCDENGTAPNGTTSVSNISRALAGMIDLAPNPSKDMTTVYYHFGESTGDNTIVITDMYGKTINKLENLPATGNVVFNTTTLSGGIYTFTGYSNGKQTQAKKLVVIK